MHYSKELYSKAALLKAAFLFTSRAYVHLDSDDSGWIVELRPKEGFPAPDCDEFDNEMLLQATREVVYERTKTVRELLVARAMASSVIGAPRATIEPPDPTFGDMEEETSLLSDWFDE